MVEVVADTADVAATEPFIERITTPRTLRRLFLFLMLSLGIALAGSLDYIPNVDGKSLNGEQLPSTRTELLRDVRPPFEWSA